jgi:cytochrome bd-type quinol oxidase subunit 1
VGRHLALGAAAAVLMLVWVAVLDGMGSYMLTPVDGASTWANVWNPTWLPLALHRLMGELVMAGYVIAAYGAWRLGRPGSGEHRDYDLFLVKLGWLGGLGALLLQPFTGLIYASWIRQAAPEAYDQIVRGPYQLLAYVQFALLGLLIVGNYLLLKTSLPDRPSRWLDWVIPAAAVLMIASVGHTVLRRASLYALVVLTLWSVRPLFTKTRRQQLFRAPTFGRSLRPIAITLGVLSVLIYLTMGTIRETARRPDTVRHVISLKDEAERPAVYREGAEKNREAASFRPERQD